MNIDDSRAEKIIEALDFGLASPALVALASLTLEVKLARAVVELAERGEALSDAVEAYRGSFPRGQGS